MNGTKPVPGQRASGGLALVLSLCGLLAVIGLWLHSARKSPEVSKPGPVPENPGERTALTEQVFEDADRADTPLLEGQRYEVRIRETSRDGSSGITQMGGRTVFVRGARKGDHVRIELTAVKKTVAEGVPVVFLHSAPRESTLSPIVEPLRSEAPERTVSVEPGEQFTVRIQERDRKNPETDGVTRIDGLVVFVPDSRPGETVRIRITERRDRFARAEVIGRPQDAGIEGMSK
ncbi:MAG: TRAM domain-containing protein [Kiritimatiellia bacterium]|nr:TRAM domain-containing protein [Kiritimatiellia bacterium]